MKNPDVTQAHFTLAGKKTGNTITRITFDECEADTSDETIIIAAAKLKAALWEPEVNTDPESPEDWGGWHWSFKLDDGTHASLSNDRRGGANWTLWVKDAADSQRVAEVLLDVIAASGSRARTRGY